VNVSIELTYIYELTPIVVRLAGRITSLIRVLSKADSAIVLKPSGNIILVIVVLYIKATYAIEVTDVSKENSPLHPPPLVRFPPVVGVSVGPSAPAYRTVYVPALQGKMKSVVGSTA